MNTFEFGKTRWIDMESPTRDEIREISFLYDVHPEIAEELISPASLPTYKRVDDTIFLSLFFPALKHSHHERIQEVDFILHDSTLITTHYDLIDALHKIKKEYEVDLMINLWNERSDAFPIFNDIVRKLYKSLRHEIEYILSDINRIEKEIFSGREKTMVEEISARSTMLLSIIRTLSLNRSAIEAFVSDVEKNRDDVQDFIVSIERNHDRTLQLAKDAMSALKELRETNVLLVTIHQNDILKNLAIISFICFPLALIAGIFGMNASHIPIVGHPFDFWIVITMMLILTFIFFLAFYYKKWL
jgi:magnesium transporter